MKFEETFAMVAEEQAIVDSLDTVFEKIRRKYLDSLREDCRRRLADSAGGIDEQVAWALVQGLLKDGNADQLKRVFDDENVNGTTLIKNLIDENAFSLPFDNQKKMASFLFVPLRKTASEKCALDCSTYSDVAMPQCRVGRYEKTGAGCECGKKDQCIADTAKLPLYSNEDGKSWYKTLLVHYIFDTMCSNFGQTRCQMEGADWCRWYKKEQEPMTQELFPICSEHSGSGSVDFLNEFRNVSLESKSGLAPGAALTQTVKSESAFMKTIKFLQLTQPTVKQEIINEDDANKEMQFGLQSLSNHLVALIDSDKEANFTQICRQYRNSHCCPALDGDIRLSSTLLQPTKVSETTR
jgi:hypothetical protein